MVSCSGWFSSPESDRGVTPFRVSIFRDLRSILYAGVVPSEYYVHFDHAASTLVLLNPALRCVFHTPNQRWQVLLDDASSIPSFIINPSHWLDEVTTSGSRLIAFSPLLLTFDDQSPAIGGCSLPSTGEVGVDDYSFSVYHRTNIDTQLSKNKVRSLPSIPPPR